MIKKSFWEKFAVALFLLLLLSCKTKTTEVEPVPHWFDEYSSFNKKDYQQYFSREINALSPDFMLFGNAVKQFYQQRDYEQLWTLNGLQEHSILKDEYYPKLLKSNTAVVNKEHLYVIHAKSKLNITLVS